jgi:16S rRNA A1518/A1519 N6-dimethyltransferase RsmA/KsgA/DIM1 with predicted DNA glycosylase/AP lyase activity
MLPLRSIYQFIAEEYDMKHWHYYEVPETKIESNDIVVDCGAGEGLFSLKVSNIAKKVYAVEPLPSFIESLYYTFKQHENVDIIPFA